MEQITNAQLQKLHLLLKSTGKMPQKAELVFAVSEFRTTSSRELTKQEASELISMLAEQDPRERQIAAIKALSYAAGMSIGNTAEDRKMNMAKINAFLRARGSVKKVLYEMDLPELIEVHKQFAAIVKANQKTAENRTAKMLTNQLLEELNLTVCDKKGIPVHRK